jgi:hypothetical protein
MLEVGSRREHTTVQEYDFILRRRIFSSYVQQNNSLYLFPFINVSRLEDKIRHCFLLQSIIMFWVCFFYHKCKSCIILQIKRNMQRRHILAKATDKWSHNEETKIIFSSISLNSPCTGGSEHLHRTLASHRRRRRRRKYNLVLGGNNWATFSLGDINTSTAAW